MIKLKPNEVYKKPIDLIILGDSYAEGWCYNEKDDVAGLLREKNINSLNFGIAGAGPILSLAVMREYVKNLNPKYFARNIYKHIINHFQNNKIPKDDHG